MKRTNIMLSEDQHKQLKSYAQKKGKTIGCLVRDALDYVYKKEDEIEHRRRVAVSAYREGFISLGKLAEVLGLDPVSTRDYLNKKGIPILSQDTKDLAQDSENA